MLVLKIQGGVQTATFESRLLVGGFNPHNPQRYGGSVAENCSTRSRTGATKSAAGVSGMAPFSIPGVPGPPFESATLVCGFNPPNPQRLGGPVAEMECCPKALWGPGAAEGGPGPPQGRARRFQAKPGGGTFVFLQC